MKEILKRGATSNILRVFLADSASTTGAGKTGLTNTSSGLIISTIADVEATATTYTSAASNTETITTLGTFAAPSSGKARFKEVDATNFPGIYEIQIADARFNVSNATQLLVSVLATGIAPTFAEIQLVTVDLYDATRFGLSALPNAAAEASGGLITRGTGTGQISLSSGAVTVGTNNDKTGYSLATAPPTSADIADAVWDEALSGHLSSGSTGNALNAAGSAGDPWSTALPGAYGAGTAGKIIGDNINATISSRLAASAITLSSGAVTVGTNNDKTGYSLTQSFPSNFSSLAITAGGAVTAGTVSDKTGYSLATAPPTSADIADAVWDEALSGHLASGSTGNALNAAGSAGDPWSTALPGAYGAGTAGKIIGDNLNATVSSRLASSAITLSSGAVTVGTNNDKTGYSLSQSFPSNFSSLAITAGGAVTAGTVSDKTGYSLSSSQTFNVTGNITGNLSGSVGSVTGAVGSVTNAVTVGTINNDVITAASISADAGAEIADAVWDETTSGHTTAGTYGGRVLRATSSNVEVQVTGSNHVAADIHELQAGVITSADFTAGAINANALATDAVTEIAQGVLTEATSTNTGVYAAGDVGNVLGRLHNMIEADGADFRYTTNALEQAPSGGGGGGGWELNADQTTGLKRMISAIVGVGGETATPGVLEFDMIGETTTLRITQSTDGNDRLTVEEV